MTPTISTEGGTVRAYRRISVATEESGSLDQQRDAIERWRDFARPGAEIVWYTDEGISGGKAERLKQRQRLLRELQPGDTLICTKVDRLARNVKDLLDIIEQAESAGAAVVFKDQNIDTSGAYGRFTIFLLGALGALEREVTSERVKTARQAMAAQNRLGAGFPPRPYFETVTVEGQDGKKIKVVRPHPVEGQKLRQAILAVIDGATIADQARVLGISARRFGKLLRNTRLYGKPPGGTVEPEAGILSMSEWQAAQARLTRDKAWAHVVSYAPALRCHCGGRMYPNMNRYRGRGAYVCHPARRPGSADDDVVHAVIQRPTVDDFIEQTFLERFGALPTWRVTVATDTERADRLAAVAMELADATDALRAPGTDIPALTKLITELHWEREAIEMEPVEEVPMLEQSGRTVADWWRTHDAEDRVAKVGEHLQVIVYPTGTRADGRLEAVELEPKGALEVAVRGQVVGSAPARVFTE